MIEFLYFEGCPHYPSALSLLKDILKEENVEPPEPLEYAVESVFDHLAAKKHVVMEQGSQKQREKNRFNFYFLF